MAARSFDPGDIVTIELDACNAEELFIEHVGEGYLKIRVTPPGMWMRVDTDVGRGGWPVVSIMGPYSVVKPYVEEHWGDDVEFDRWCVKTGDV